MLKSPEFDYTQAKTLHLEPTTACNLQCPMCARQDPCDHTRINHRVEMHSMTLESAKQSLKNNFLLDLDKILLCGSLGDPAAAPEILDICKWIKTVNPDIQIGMNTNGSLRSSDFWKQLAQIQNHPLDYVVFSIDGTDKTNHVYRIGANWKKLINNVTAFVNAGGVAHWDMLIFNHNKHEIEHCEKLAKQLGFSWFRAKQSNRVWHGHSEIIATSKMFRQDQVTSRPTSCPADNKKDVYMDSYGKFWPCCDIQSDYYTDGPEGDQLRSEIQQIEDSAEVIKNNWDKKVFKTCINNCGIVSTNKNITDAQFKIEKQL
jgi:MoaA/NifB/PqqE/SkfB family radical SAM enzyme